jgi:dolichyl-phosphate beta-glucosyltransferase
VYSLSIIIPLFNEEKRLLKSLIRLDKFIKQNKKKNIEIIFVNDGSTDTTNKIIDLFIKENKKNIKFSLIKYKKNVGKGYAIKKGILKSKKNWILICDADMSVNPNQFNIWYNSDKIIDKNKAYFGSRRHKKSNVKSSTIRKFLGYFFIIFIRILFFIKLRDSQCGFKVFHKSYALKAFRKISSFRFAFDIELIIILTKLKINIIELPLKWVHQDGSKLSLLYDMPKMIYDIFVIRFKNLK